MRKLNRISAILITMAMLIAMMAVNIPNGMSKVNATMPPYYPYDDPEVHIQGHVQNIGWQGVSKKGFAGTTGKSLRLEAFKIGIMKAPYEEDETNSQHDGLYEGHVFVNVICGTGKNRVGIKQVRANCGEMSNVCGTTGQSQPIYAVSLSLDGEISRYYDIKYRIHVQNEGWKPWVKNGVITKGNKYQPIEAIEVELERNRIAPHYPLYPDPIPVPDPPTPNPFPIGGDDGDDLRIKTR